VQAIIKVAKTDRVGDGRIMVTSVAEFWNIRTGKNEAESHASYPQALKKV